MDVWAWVVAEQTQLRDAGHERLAHLLDAVPDAVTDGEQDLADTMVLEGLALARSLKRSWVEIFLRHWRLQGRVLTKMQGIDSLPECVSLLDFASRPENRDCPQSVCVTQDLVACYSIMDGPGYAEERIAASQQALDRIDPRWQCFECISAELASALTEQGRPKEALEFIAKQRRAHEKVRKRGEDRLDLFGQAANAHFELGEYEQQLRETKMWAKSWTPGNEGDTGLLSRNLEFALCYFALKRPEDALLTLPTFEEVRIAHDELSTWGEAMLLGARLGAVCNDSALGQNLQESRRVLERNGAADSAAAVATSALELAISRRRAGLSRILDEDARRLIARLKKPAQLQGLVDGLQSERADLPHPTVHTDTPEGWMERLPQDPEEALELLLVGAEKWPRDERTIAGLVEGLAACGLHPQAICAARSYLESEAHSIDIVTSLAALLQTERRFDELDELIASLDHGSVSVQWMKVRRSQAKGDLDETATTLEELLTADPRQRDARLLLADVERNRGRLRAALAQLTHLLREEVSVRLDCDRMIVATLLGEWQAVRESAGRCGLLVGGEEGPIDEDAEECLIRVPGERAEETLQAVRTGPVTARLTHVAAPDHPQRYGDLVVFEPGSLERAEEGVRSSYELVETMKHGDCQSFSIDGIAPSGETLKSWALSAGVGLRVIFGRFEEGAADEEPESDAELYAYMAAPKELPLRELHERLDQATREFGLQLAWVGLTMRLGDTSLEAEHRATLKRLGIEPD